MDDSLKIYIRRALLSLTLLTFILCVFLIVKILNENKEDGPYDTITVDATAEAFASPDIAEISFSARSEDKELSNAQADIEQKISLALQSIKDLGILEKDIKTTYYSAYPRYEYGKAICQIYRCDSGERALIGYEATQSINVIIRDLDNVSKVIALLGSSQVTDIYGPNFRIENEDDLKNQTRKEAIEKANLKAKDLAKSLGVKIIGVESFSEGGGGLYERGVMMNVVEDKSAPTISPTIPQGENKIISTVYITFKVR